MQCSAVPFKRYGGYTEDMPNIRTVIFDLGGVYFTEGVRQFVRKMQERFSVDEQQVRHIVDGELGRHYRTGEATPAQFWSEAMAFWKLDSSKLEDVKASWLEGYVPIEGTIDIIEALRGGGYELLFLSDNAPDRVEYLESRYHFLGRFKAGVFSNLVGVRKPHPKMYEAALKLTATPAQECVYIDDKPPLLEPAKALGVHTIAFKDPEQLKTDLRALGVAI